MKKSIFTMLTMSLLSGSLLAQQWSSDPVVDSLKQHMADLIKAQEFMDYCHRHPHEKECDGVNDGTPSTFVPYDEALKVGQQKLDQEKAPKEQPKPADPSLGEVARQQRVLKMLEQAARDFCAKNPDAKSCKELTPAQIAQRVLKASPNLEAYVKAGRLQNLSSTEK